MQAAHALLRAVERLAQAIVVAMMAAMLALVVFQFIDRHIAAVAGGFAADEYVKVALIWVCVVGYGLAMRAGTEIRVDIVDQHLPPRLRRVLFAAVDLLLLALLTVVLVKGWRLFEVAQMQTILGTDMTVAVPVAGMLAGCALMFLAVLLRLARRLTGGAEPPASH